MSHGSVSGRRIDLKHLIAERFGVVYHERTVGKLLHQLGFAHVSARPRHPAQDVQWDGSQRVLSVATRVIVDFVSARGRSRRGGGRAQFS